MHAACTSVYFAVSRANLLYSELANKAKTIKTFLLI